MLEDSETKHKKYLDDLKNLAHDEMSNELEVEALHIKEFDAEMYYQFIYFPAEMISSFDLVIKSMYERMFIDPETNPLELEKKRLRRERLMVSIVGLQHQTILKDLSPKDINRLISFRGIVIRCSDINPEMKAAAFKCSHCGH